MTTPDPAVPAAAQPPRRGVGDALRTWWERQSRPAQWGIGVLAFGALALLPVFDPPLIATTATNFGTTMAQFAMVALIAIGLNVVVGQAGLLDLGYVGFYAVGAYVVALLTSPASPIWDSADHGIFSGPWAWMACIPLAIVITGITGVILGTPTLRVRGDYLAIVTLGFGEIVRLLADNLKDIHGIELANLVADAKALFTACLMDASEYVRFLFKIAARNDDYSWHHVIEGLDLVSRLCDDRDRRALSKVVVAMLQELADSQGWDLSPTSEGLLPVFSGFKPYHLNLNPMVRKLSGVFYRDWRKNPEAVDAFRTAQAAMVLHFARAKVVPEFSNLQLQAKDATPLHIQQYLLHLDQRYRQAVRGEKADFFMVLADIILHPGRSAEGSVQRFLEEWPETISPETPPIQVVYKVLYSGIVDADTADLEAKLKRCFRRYKSHIAQSAINRTMERIRANVVMREKQSAAIKVLCKVLLKELKAKPSRAKLKLFKVEQ